MGAYVPQSTEVPALPGPTLLWLILGSYPLGMLGLIRLFLGSLVALFRSRAAIVAENLALRHQPDPDGSLLLHEDYGEPPVAEPSADFAHSPRQPRRGRFCSVARPPLRFWRSTAGASSTCGRDRPTFARARHQDARGRQASACMRRCRGQESHGKLKSELFHGLAHERGKIGRLPGRDQIGVNNHLPVLIERAGLFQFISHRLVTCLLYT